MELLVLISFHALWKFWNFTNIQFVNVLVGSINTQIKEGLNTVGGSDIFLVRTHIHWGNYVIKVDR